MRRLRYLASAIADFEEIYLYLRREGTGARSARRFVKRLRDRCDRIAALPGHMGRPRPELGEGIRSSVLGNYVIFFRYEDAVLVIANVLEGHRDIDAQFGGEEN